MGRQIHVASHELTGLSNGTVYGVEIRGQAGTHTQVAYSIGRPGLYGATAGPRHLPGTSGDDYMKGYSGTYDTYFNQTTTELSGLGGDDVLIAGDLSGFTTTLNGGPGDDILGGGTGNDILNGGAGDDVS